METMMEDIKALKEDVSQLKEEISQYKYSMEKLGIHLTGFEDHPDVEKTFWLSLLHDG